MAARRAGLRVRIGTIFRRRMRAARPQKGTLRAERVELKLIRGARKVIMKVLVKRSHLKNEGSRLRGTRLFKRILFRRVGRVWIGSHLQTTLPLLSSIKRLAPKKSLLMRVQLSRILVSVKLSATKPMRAPVSTNLRHTWKLSSESPQLLAA